MVCVYRGFISFLFFFNDPAPTEIYTLSLHDALPIYVKEHRFPCDTRPGDRVFYYTTCGWMMWNWLVGGLAVEETLFLFDGSPLDRKSTRLNSSHANISYAVFCLKKKR